MSVQVEREFFELLSDGSGCSLWTDEDGAVTRVDTDYNHYRCFLGDSYRWRPDYESCELCWVKHNTEHCIGETRHNETLGEWLRRKIVELAEEPEPESDFGGYHTRGPQPINRRSNNPDNNHNNHVHVRRVDRVDRVDRAAQSPSRFEFLGYVDYREAVHGRERTSGGEINTHQGHNSGQALIDEGTGYERVVHITTPDGYNLAYSLFFD